MSTHNNRFANGLEWPIVIFIGLVHILTVVLCILYPTWEGFACMLVMYLATGLGITVGYHRKLTHQSFQSPKWIDHTLAVLGILAGEGPPIFWVAHHRKHHKHSDGPEDPHSPNDGFGWAHWLWLFPKQNSRALGSLYRRWTPDLLKNPFYCWLERNYLYLQLSSMAVIFGIGYLIGSWQLALSFLAYGYFLRMVLVLHATWLVNSASHKWGYRNYETSDNSRNNVFVGFAALGEGWHNNHHYVQGSANHGHKAQEIDISFAIIMLLAIVSWPLAWVGLGNYRLAYNVKFYSHRKQKILTFFRQKR